MLKCFIFEFQLVVVGCVVNLPTSLIGNIMIRAIGKNPIKIYTYSMQVSSAKHNLEYKGMSSAKPKQIRQAMSEGCGTQPQKRKGVVGDIQ